MSTITQRLDRVEAVFDEGTLGAGHGPRGCGRCVAVAFYDAVLGSEASASAGGPMSRWVSMRASRSV